MKSWVPEELLTKCLSAYMICFVETIKRRANLGYYTRGRPMK